MEGIGLSLGSQLGDGRRGLDLGLVVAGWMNGTN